MASDVTLTYRGVRITVLAGPYLRDRRPTEQAVKYYLDLFGHLDDFRQFAADQLLSLYRDAWADEDDPPMDQGTFTTKLINPAIILFGDIGRAGVYFDDSGLFLGHGIEIMVEGTTSRRADLVG